MPGVPGRGCESCSQAKKKCDQRRPKCTRCTRLCKPCVGGGVQRYKFRQFTAQSFETNDSDSRQLQQLHATSSRPLPGSPLTADFVHKLENKDIRYDLCWSYGSFFSFIPARIGDNATLDASAAVMLVAYREFGSRSPSLGFWRSYSSAIEALRSSLSGPAPPDPYYTLASIYLIWMSQSWVGLATPSHSTGAMAVLSRATQTLIPQNEFQRELLLAVGGTIVFDRLFYEPRVSLEPVLAGLLIDNEPDLTQMNSPLSPPKRRGLMGCVMDLPSMLVFDPSSEPKVRAEHSYISREAVSTQARIEEYEDKTRNGANRGSTEGHEDLDDRWWERLHRLYSVQLSVQRILNGILRAYSPDDVDLQEEAVQIGQKMETMVRAMSVANPLGAAWIPFCLISIWCTAMDEGELKRVETIWRECWSHLSLEQTSGRLPSMVRQLREDSKKHSRLAQSHGEASLPSHVSA